MNTCIMRAPPGSAGRGLRSSLFICYCLYIRQRYHGEIMAAGSAFQLFELPRCFFLKTLPMQSTRSVGEGTSTGSKNWACADAPVLTWARRTASSEGTAGCSAAEHLAEPAKRRAVRFLLFLASCSIGHESRDGTIELQAG